MFICSSFISTISYSMYEVFPKKSLGHENLLRYLEEKSRGRQIKRSSQASDGHACNKLVLTARLDLFEKSNTTYDDCNFAVQLHLGILSQVPTHTLIKRGFFFSQYIVNYDIFVWSLLVPKYLLQQQIFCQVETFSLFLTGVH